MATDTKKQFRVYRVSESLRKAVKAKSANVGVKAVLDAAVTESLPKVVAALQSVGFGMAKGKVRPAKWPVDKDFLDCLRVASSQVGGLPCSTLLAASLVLFCQKKGAK